MTKVKDIYNLIDEIAPFKTALSFDNVGLLVGNFEEEVTKILISLDITNEVCSEAKMLGAQLILSHHPVIFSPLKNLNSNSVPFTLAKFQLNAICAHTNLDLAPNGVNFCLAKRLGLRNISKLEVQDNGLSLGLVGEISQKTDIKNFAMDVKAKLGCKGVKYTDIKKEIQNVAVCSGSGGDLVSTAKEKHADILVTGEIKHNQIIEANSLGIAIIEAGHFKTENVVTEYLEKLLKEKFPKVQTSVSKIFEDKIRYI